jgi:hypothetical protein
MHSHACGWLGQFFYFPVISWRGCTERLEGWLRATLAADFLVPGGSISRLTFWYQQLQALLDGGSHLKNCTDRYHTKSSDGSPTSKVVFFSPASHPFDTELVMKRRVLATPVLGVSPSTNLLMR